MAGTLASDSRELGDGVVGHEERFVVVGGSIAGLATALSLSRSGFEVTMVEQDSLPLAADPEEAFMLARPGTPQVHAVHVFLARLVQILRQRFPDVLETLAEHGVPLEPAVDFADLGDDVQVLRVRRSTIEWILLKTILNEANVRVVTGHAVRGLVTDGPREGRPLVSGVVLDDGSTVDGVVVCCTGRRGDVNAWLHALGVEIGEDLIESERVYSSRWYSVSNPSIRTTILRDLGFLTYLALPADAGTLSVGVSVHPADKELRACLYDDDAFDRLVRELPIVGPWLEAVEAKPIMSVKPMAGMINRLRRYVDDDGAPLVLGFHAVGDSHTLTNPIYGRGCSLAFVQATLLADAATAHRADPAERARAFEAGSAQQVEPWFHNSVFMDRSRLDSADEADNSNNGLPPLDRIMPVLMEGSAGHEAVTEGLTRMMNLIVTPTELFSDPAFGEGLAALMAALPDAPPEPTGPNREEVLAVARPTTN